MGLPDRLIPIPGPRARRIFHTLTLKRSNDHGQSKSTSARTATPGSIAQENPPFTAEERYRMIAEAAYFRAEKRGFLGGNVAEDWLDVEAEIDRMLRSRTPSLHDA